MDDEREGIEIDETETDLCRGLWLAVLMQICTDAKTKGSDSRARKIKADALAWLAQPNEDSDFATVCELADVKPAIIRERVRSFLRTGESTDFRVLRKSRPRKKRIKADLFFDRPTSMNRNLMTCC